MPGREGSSMTMWIGLGIMTLVTAFWVWPGIDVQRIPEQQFRAAGTDKFMWKVIVVYLPIAGGIIWLCTKRKDVRAAARP
jgi:hypothetical protein